MSADQDVDLVLTVVRDLVKDLLNHDRRDDEDLPKGRIEELVAAGDLTLEDIVEAFQDALAERLDVDEDEERDDDEEGEDEEDDEEDEDD